MEFVDAVDRLHSALKEICAKQSKLNPQKKSWATDSCVIPWSWVAVSVARLLNEYSTGLTETVILGELELQWERASLRQTKGLDANFGTIQSVYDGRNAVALEVTAKEWWRIPDSDIWLVSVSDGIGYKGLDMYLHPKYNPWVVGSRPSLQNAQPFLKDRTMRIFTGPKSNSPIASQYGNKEIPRISRIARIPPSELIMFMLKPEDVPFIRAEFTDALHTVIQPGFMGTTGKKIYKLWLKIIHFDHVEHIASNQNPHRDLLVDSEEAKAPRLRRTDVYVVDMCQDSNPAILSLYDEQTELVSMLEEGDYVGLYNPGFAPHLTESQEANTDMILQYTDETVLFVMSEKDAQAAGVAKATQSRPLQYADLLSQQSSSSNARNNSPNSPMADFWRKQQQHKSLVERDEDGFIDCTKYPNRIYIKDLEPCMLNITLFCRIVAVASNNPFTKEGSDTRMDRYAMRVVDSTGKIDVTLWEQAGRDARQLRPGQYVLLTGLSTSGIHRTSKGATWYVNGSLICGTEIFNVSAMKTLLTSTCLRRILPIQGNTHQEQWQIEAIVVGWELRTRQDPDKAVRSDGYNHENGIECPLIGQKSIADCITMSAHTACLQPVRFVKRERAALYQERLEESDIGRVLVCEFCKCLTPEEQVVQTFRSKPSSTSSPSEEVEGWIEWRLDDGSGAVLTACGCDETLLNVSAQQFKFMSHKAQVGLLDSVMGKQVLCSVSSTGHDSFRIDQVAPRQPSQHECLELLRSEEEGAISF